jgi:exosome complex RNA-binding protein Rrp42 (RNase PH superfamily)
MNLEFGEMLNRVLNGDQGGLDLRSLCIIPGSTCWVVYVDALVCKKKNLGDSPVVSKSHFATTRFWTTAAICLIPFLLLPAVPYKMH